MATKSRLLSRLIKGDGNIKTTQFDSDAIGTSAAKSITAASGTIVYSSADTLPTSANAGDQAFVSSTNRLYIFNGSGWYNIALINTAPYWSSEASSSYNLNTDGTSTTITLLAVDSEGIPITYTAVTDSDFDNIATISKDSDNGRTFTITPIDSDNGTAISGTGTVTFRASDGVNLVSTLSTFSLTFINAIENSNYTTLLAKADAASTDNQVDASTNNHTITEGGDVTSTAFTPYHPGGYSTYFDGANDNITATNMAISGDCTFEFWFYQNVAQSTAYRCLLATSTYGSGIPFTIYTYSSNVQVWLSSSGSAEISGAFTASTWHHIALVRNSGTWTLYIDGTSAGTSTTGGSYDFAGTTDWRFGENHSGSYDYQGYIKDARIVNGTAVYTSAFTPPTEPLTAIANTSLLTCHLPYIADGSSNNQTLTFSVTTKRFSPYDYTSYSKSTDGGSVYFDGTGDYITTSTGVTSIAAGDYTVELWWYPTTTVTAQQTLVHFNAGSSGGTNIWCNTSGQLVVDNGTAAQSAFTGANFVLQQWNHVVVTRSGSTTTGYINGVVAGTNTYTPAASDRVQIGRYKTEFWYTVGYIADFRYVAGTVVYTAAFTPPTEPLTAITNTELLTCTNKNDIWDATGTCLFENAGVTSDNTVRKFTTSSSYSFNTHYLNIVSDNVRRDFTFGKNSEPYTIEFWMRMPDRTARRTWFSCGGGAASWSTTDGNHLNVFNWTTYCYVQFNNSGSAVSLTFDQTDLTNDQWHHIAYTYDGTTHRFFLDGTVKATGTGSVSAITGGTYVAYWGRGADGNDAYDFDGYMQDMRITKGLARYTSTFTPPTAEFDG